MSKIRDVIKNRVILVINRGTVSDANLGALVTFDTPGGLPPWS